MPVRKSARSRSRRFFRPVLITFCPCTVILFHIKKASAAPSKLLALRRRSTVEGRKAPLPMLNVREIRAARCSSVNVTRTARRTVLVAHEFEGEMQTVFGERERDDELALAQRIANKYAVTVAPE